jgi:hypothetical protein
LTHITPSATNPDMYHVVFDDGTVSKDVYNKTRAYEIKRLIEIMEEEEAKKADMPLEASRKPAGEFYPHPATPVAPTPK